VWLRVRDRQLQPPGSKPGAVADRLRHWQCSGAGWRVVLLLRAAVLRRPAAVAGEGLCEQAPGVAAAVPVAMLGRGRLLLLLLLLLLGAGQ
jgi:hypothetical protein